MAIWRMVLPPQGKAEFKLINKASIGIVSAYKDMLPLHQPLQDFPAQIKYAVRAMGSGSHY